GGAAGANGCAGGAPANVCPCGGSNWGGGTPNISGGGGPGGGGIAPIGGWATATAADGAATAGGATKMGPGPVTVPTTSIVPPPGTAKRTVTTEPSIRSPVVVPLQVVLSVADTAVQAPAGHSMPIVVDRKIAGTLP